MCIRDGEGTARLRISLSAAHSIDDVRQLVQALRAMPSLPHGA